MFKQKTEKYENRSLLYLHLSSQKENKYSAIHEQKLSIKLQSYPVNLALKVSSMILLLISNKIILDNESVRVFDRASFCKTLKLFAGIQDGRWELLLVTWRASCFRMPQFPDRGQEMPSHATVFFDSWHSFQTFFTVQYSKTLTIKKGTKESTTYVRCSRNITTEFICFDLICFIFDFQHLSVWFPKVICLIPHTSFFFLKKFAPFDF